MISGPLEGTLDFRGKWSSSGIVAMICGPLGETLDFEAEFFIWGGSRNSGAESIFFW